MATRSAVERVDPGDDRLDVAAADRRPHVDVGELGDGEAVERRREVGDGHGHAHDTRGPPRGGEADRGRGDGQDDDGDGARLLDGGEGDGQRRPPRGERDGRQPEVAQQREHEEARSEPHGDQGHHAQRRTRAATAAGAERPGQQPGRSGHGQGEADASDWRGQREADPESDVAMQQPREQAQPHRHHLGPMERIATVGARRRGAAARTAGTACGALLLTAAWSDVRAQDAAAAARPAASASAVPAASGAPPTAALEPVVVTARRTRETAFDAPAAVSAVGREAIESAGPQVNLSESLVRVPGIAVLNRQNYAQDLQLSIRGFGARSTFGIRGVRLVVDGIPATMPDGQGQASNVALGSAGRVEVLRGPLAQLYGNAAGGVVQVFTAEEPERPTVTTSLTEGRFGFSRQSLVLAGRVGPRDGLTLDVSRFRTDGPRPHAAAERWQGNGLWRRDWSNRVRTTSVVNVLDQPRADDPLGLTREQLQADRGRPRRSPSSRTRANRCARNSSARSWSGTWIRARSSRRASTSAAAVWTTPSPCRPPPRSRRPRAAASSPSSGSTPAPGCRWRTACRSPPGARCVSSPASRAIACARTGRAISTSAARPAR
jgi:hypothetical protein